MAGGFDLPRLTAWGLRGIIYIKGYRCDGGQPLGFNNELC